MRKAFLILSLIMLVPFVQHQSTAASFPEDYQRANTLFAGGKFGQAIPLYQKLLDSPFNTVPASDIHTRIADSYFRLSLFPNALAEYRSALKGQKERDRPGTQYWIGFCSFLLGRDDEAVKELLKIPQLYPRSRMWVETAYYWAGRASERMGKSEEAAAYYRKAGRRAKESGSRSQGPGSKE